MRLSDAIELGSTLIKARPYFVFSKDHTAGCALGMASAAMGFTRWRNLEEWAWLKKKCKIHPCICFLDREKNSSYYNVLTHLFDVHVVRHYDFYDFWRVKPWTLDQLIAWVRSVEPKEVTQEKLNLDRSEEVVLHS